MKKYSSSFQNPQHQDLYFYGFSKQSKRQSPNLKTKRSHFQLNKSNSKSDISLPSIDFHVPSYEIINNARKKKKETALSTPKLSDRHLIDFTMKNVMSKNHKFDSLSSKVDFFSTRNQKRLDIQKRKVYVDMGMFKVEKSPIFSNRNSIGPSPEIFKLLQKYVSQKQRSESKENSFVAVGKEFQSSNNEEQTDLQVDLE